MIRPILMMSTLGLVLAAHPSPFDPSPPQAGVQAQDQEEAQASLDLAREYLAGLEAGTLEALDRLFLPDQRSTVLENTSDEGSWEHYREHHLAPELQSASGFAFTVEKESSQRFGSTSVVRQIGRFTLGSGESSKNYRAAVTYVVVEEKERRLIAHLHWSSRAEK